MKTIAVFLLTFLLASLPSVALAAQPMALYDYQGNPIGSTFNAGQYYLNVNASLTEVATAAPGAAAPAVDKIVGGVDGGNLAHPLLVDASGRLQMTSVNGSVGSTGAAVPSSATFMGVKDSGGNLLGLTLGQALMSASLPVTIASNQSALSVTQSGAPWSENITQFGGNAVATGTGISGVGVPRVTVANDSKVQIWDATNTATVKAASTAAVATDTAVVVAISPNSTAPKTYPNSGGSGSAAAATVSTVITLSAPANAVGFFLQNDGTGTSTAAIRWAIGRTATTTLGQELQPGQDTGFVPCGANVSLVAVSGTQTYDIQWVTQ
jgi:hypothetical protein